MIGRQRSWQSDTSPPQLQDDSQSGAYFTSAKHVDGFGAVAPSSELSPPTLRLPLSSISPQPRAPEYSWRRPGPRPIRPVAEVPSPPTPGTDPSISESALLGPQHPQHHADESIQENTNELLQHTPPGEARSSLQKGSSPSRSRSQRQSRFPLQAPGTKLAVPRQAESPFAHNPRLAAALSRVLGDGVLIATGSPEKSPYEESSRASGVIRPVVPPDGEVVGTGSSGGGGGNVGDDVTYMPGGAVERTTTSPPRSQPRNRQRKEVLGSEVLRGDPLSVTGHHYADTAGTKNWIAGVNGKKEEPHQVRSIITGAFSNRNRSERGGRVLRRATLSNRTLGTAQDGRARQRWEAAVRLEASSTLPAKVSV